MGETAPAPQFASPGVAETHSAWVVFLGDRAYKLKKPVKLDLLDFSTREARERIAHREVELNRRLAPDVYLGVADVRGPDGRICDHLVVMRRMPAERRLSTLVEAGAPLDDQIRAIARAVAAFHAAAETSPAIAAAGAPEAILDKVERDLAELEVFAGA
jgi:aminoglycoside phosphotransferase family enzyme